MPGNNLTLQGTPTYNSTGKFGADLNGGNGYTTVQPITAYPFTIEAWCKAVSSGNIEVVAGRAACGWFGKAANNTALAHFNNQANDTTLTTSVNIADGSYHHLALVVTATGATFYVDGVSAATSAVAPVFSAVNNYFGVRAYFSAVASATATFPFTGDVDEVAVWNTAKYSANFTPPTAAYAGTESGLGVLYHLDSNGNDSTAAPALDATKLQFSPANWSISANSAKTINDGAYFKGAFSGASCTLGFDISATSSPLPKMIYRVDGVGAWVSVDLAASIVLTMPTETAAMPTHTFEMHVAQTSEANSRWSPQNTAIIVNAITLASGGAQITPPAAKLLNLLMLGDSIFNGVNSLYVSSGDTTLRGRAQMAYPYYLCEALGAEMGLASFGGQGWVTTGGGSVPVFPSTYNQLFSGTARSFAGLDAIIINQGQNDGSNATTTQVTTVLNALIAATDRRCKIVVLRPLSGNQAANLIAGIAACTDPTRVTYVNTAGWFNNANSIDGIHPAGFEHRLGVYPAAIAALRPILAPLAGQRTAQSITNTLTDGAGNARTNLSGLKWAIYDQATPTALGAAADSGANLSTDSGGVFTLSVFSTKASGGIVWLIISNSDGTTTQSPAAMAFNGPVALN